MARIRNIKPEFFTDEDMADLSIWDRLFYVGLWTQADRSGRLEDKPKSLKVRIFPYDDYNAAEGLDRLVAGGFIKRYTVDSVNYLWIVKFTEHQCFSGSEAKSKLPPHPDDTGKKRSYDAHMPPVEPGGDEPSTVDEPLDNCCATVEQHADIGHRTHDIGHRTKDEGQKASSSPDGDGGAVDSSPYPAAFEAFWQAYPNKKAKGYALKAWQRIKGRPPVEELVAAVERAKGSYGWRKENGAFIPHPATWLNGRRWEDEIPVNGIGPVEPNGSADSAPLMSPEQCEEAQRQRKADRQAQLQRLYGAKAVNATKAVYS